MTKFTPLRYLPVINEHVDAKMGKQDEIKKVEKRHKDKTHKQTNKQIKHTKMLYNAHGHKTITEYYQRHHKKN